jgi:protein-disulfide isomerase
MGLTLGAVAVIAMVAIQRPMVGAASSIVVPSGIPGALGAPASLDGRATSPPVPGSRGAATEGDGRTLGRSSAPVTMDVWSDYQCPACRTFVAGTLPRLIAEYVNPGLVRVVYHDFAFLGPESLTAAVGARCAARSGRFETYHALVYANQGAENAGGFATPRLTAIASAAGLDASTFQACLDDPALAQAVKAETEHGRALGVIATPSLVVGGLLVRGVPAWDDLVAMLAAAGATP